MAFEPQQQELREKKIGHLIVNTGLDRPWANYFCCMFYGNREIREQEPRRYQTCPARDPKGH